jgi:hypothetical protein
MAIITLDSHTAPQLCRWLHFKEHQDVGVSNWTQAVCIRVEAQPQLVTPRFDCVGCRHWTLPEEVHSSR